MKHLGDITKISGHSAPIVDCIIGGSPCQDLSVAGKRAGLDGERSGLFMEQIRIIKEMRAQDVRNGRSGHDIRPRYMVWENVPGAFSSNKGEDFRVVLEELARVVEEGVTIPRPAKGKWATTGVIIGDGWSLAWRVFDAQYWGVPQRRRRICIVVDFNGHTAPQIVFSEGEYHGSTERGDCKPSVGYLGEEPRPEIQSLCEGLSRNLEQSLSQGEDPSSDASGSLGAGDSERTVAYTMQDREGKSGGGKGALIAEEKSATLRANNWQYVFQPSSWDGGQTSPTLTARNASGCQRMPDKDNFNAVIQPIAIDVGGGKSSVDIHTDRSPTLTTTHYGEPAVAYPSEVVTSTYGFDPSADRDVGALFLDECSKTITNGTSPGHHTGVVVALDRASFNQGKNAKYDFEVSEDGINSPIVAKGPSAVCYGIGSYDSNAWKSNNPHSGVYEADTARTLDSINCGYPACNQGGTAVVAVDCRNGTEDEKNGALQSNMAHSLNGNNVVRTRYIVRRLTPLECERLQGFPDGWTDIGEYIDTNGKKKQSSDAARYKALGNSIALPSWKWVLKRLCACYERDATMASLFDGIGGFPLIWEQFNGKGSCLWASEIEEFPIAVTKARTGEGKGIL